jgi:hypothetical protein
MNQRPSENKPRSNYEKMQIPLHFGMGSVYLLFGLLIVYVKYFGSMQLSAGVAYVLGSLLILYGGFRIWRGISLLKQDRSRF